jgi:cytochrome b
MTTTPTSTTVRVWDLPLRLFHWSLLICVIGAFVSVKIGGNAMRWHFYCGYAILTLMLFRIVWGFVGSATARFSNFPPNPVAAWLTLRGAVNSYLGHNPAGALSVYALLCSLSFQAVSGLFSNDDIASDGPLMVKVSKELSDQITSWHKINETIIIALVLLHLAAIVYHRYAKKERLVRAMITGDKTVETAGQNLATEAVSVQDDKALRLRGASVFAACVAFVWFAVNKL